MLTTLLILLTLALATPWLERWLKGRTGWVLAGVSGGIATWYALRLPLAGPLEESWEWAPTFGVQLALRLDGLSAVFALLVTGIGALVLLYAQGYMGSGPKAGRLLAYLLLFEAAMLGLVLSDDLISLFVFWELTSIASFLMVGFYHENDESRRGARKALVITGAGGLALLVGFVLLRLAAGQLGLDPGEAGRISALTQLELSSHPWYGLILTLVLLGALTKSAQIPFHIWLPAAMAAPTPVSAYLHSATMVKAGVYLLARLHPALGDTQAWHISLSVVGSITMLGAAVMALRQSDLKRVLAFSTISVLGILVALLGAGTELAIKAAVVFLVAHALYKAALFMIAGILDLQTGTRDIGRLGGLARLLPITAAAGLLAALSKAGAPPMFGFVGKELVYKAKLSLDSFGALVVLVAVLTNVALVASALLVGVKPFIGRRAPELDGTREASLPMLMGPVVLGAIGIFVGLVPGLFDRVLGSPMASAIVGYPVEMELKLWHGVDPTALMVLGLSLLTLLLGFVLYLRLGRRLPSIGPAAESGALDASFEWLMDAVPRVSARVTRLLHGGPLRRDLLVVAATAAMIILVPLLSVELPRVTDQPWPTVLELAFFALVLFGAAGTLATREPMLALLGLGATGLGMAMLFLSQGAPDLALTQLMVETLTVVLLVVILRRLPRVRLTESVPHRVRDAVVALTAGVAVGLTVLVAGAVRLEPGIARFFAESSVPEAKGRNIVNVILVDFRALDTLGESVVLALAGLGVFALMRAGFGRARVTGERSS